MMKLKEVKKAIKERRKEENINTKAKISSIEQQLKEIHSTMQIDSFNVTWQASEKKLKTVLQHWLQLEDDQVRQKSREN